MADHRSGCGVCGGAVPEPTVGGHTGLCAQFVAEGYAKELAEVRAKERVAAEALAAANVEVDRLRVQLAGCGVAARDGSEEQEAKPDAYGYSPAYADVLALRREHDALRADAERMRVALSDAATALDAAAANAAGHTSAEPLDALGHAVLRAAADAARAAIATGAKKG